MAYYRLTTNKKGHLSAKIQVYAPGLNNEKGKVHYKRIINEDDLPKTKFIKLVEREAINQFVRLLLKKFASLTS